jgi:sulfite oxidase
METQLHTANRPDEWKIEQGMAGHKLPILDQTGRDTVAIQPPKTEKIVKDEEAIKAVGDRNKLFARELEGCGKGTLSIAGSGVLLRPN